MRHVVTQGTQEHHIVINKDVERLAQPCADLQQIDGLTRQIRHEPGFAGKRPGVAFKNVGNNAAYLIRYFRVIHSILKMWFSSPKARHPASLPCH